MDKIDISIVVPVYNSRESLKELNDRIFNTMIRMGKVFEIIYVNDNSKDDSWEILLNLYREHPKNIKLINLNRNYGQQNALMCGFKFTTGEFVVTIDDDLQHSPEEIEILYNKILEGYDAVFGSIVEKKDKLHKKIGSLFIRKINHSIFKTSIKFSSFRIFNRFIITQLIQFKTPFPYIAGITLSLTSNVSNVEIKHSERKYGVSNYNFSKLINLSFNLLINYSNIPLKILSYFGIIFSIISFILGIFFMMRKIITGQGLIGWTSLFVFVAFMNTIILLIFFIIGEYISRILKELSNYQQYSIKEIKQ